MLQKYTGAARTPYISMGNNPVSNIDPDGGYIYVPQGGGIGAGYLSLFWNVQSNNTSYLSDKTFYEGEYRSGSTINAIMQKEYEGWQVQHFAQIYGTQDDPRRFQGIINEAAYAHSGMGGGGSYVVTDGKGNEHTSYTAEGAAKEQDDFGTLMQDQMYGVNKETGEKTYLGPDGKPYLLKGGVRIELQNNFESDSHTGQVDVSTYRGYEGTIQYNSHNIKRVGVFNIELKYTGNTSMKNALWLQTVKVNNGYQFFDGNNTPNPPDGHYNGSDPFYVDHTYMMDHYLDGNTVSFSDDPQSERSRSFRATTTLYNEGKPLFSIDWGYDYDHDTGIVTPYPYTIHYN